MLDMTQTTALCGFVSSVIVAAVTVKRQRRFEPSDLGSFAAAYFAGSNLPAALWLCWYVFDPDPQSVATKLHGSEKYIAFAGICFLFVTAISIWGLLRRAYVTENTAS